MPQKNDIESISYKNTYNNKRKLGSEFEDKACLFLENQGYTILERNYFNYHNEIDIIAKKDNTISFIEVKYRSSSKYGFPHDAITKKKMKSIISAAKYYLYSQGYGFDIAISFDCILILENEITHIKNAFDCLWLIK